MRDEAQISALENFARQITRPLIEAVLASDERVKALSMALAIEHTRHHDPTHTALNCSELGCVTNRTVLAAVAGDSLAAQLEASLSLLEGGKQR